MTTKSAPVSYPLAVALTGIAVGLLLTLCDRFSHVQFGVLSYANPVWFGQDWWVWPNFTGAALGMYLGAKFVAVPRLSTTPTDGQVLFSLGWFVAAYFATGVYAGTPMLLLAGLLLAWLLRLAISPDRWVVAAFSLLLAVAGCGIEGALSATGTFSYRDPEIFHVPYWLAGLYLNGSFVLLQIVRRIEQRYGKIPSAIPFP